MILAITGHDDVHAHAVARHATALGAELRIVDFAELDKQRFTLSPGKVPAGKLAGSLATVSLADELTGVWCRRPRNITPPEDVFRPEDRVFIRQQWADATLGFLESLSCPIVNRPGADAAAVKPAQLNAAEAVGLRIPRTLITNDPEAAESFIADLDGEVIHKALLATRTDRFVDTRRWAPEHRDGLATLPLAPAIFQEQIHGPADVRVTVVGTSIFAARLNADPIAQVVDSRLDLDGPYEEHVLPDEVASQLLALMRQFELTYSTVDLKIDHAGEHVFLELNPQGQFLYIEILTGLPISRAMAKLLAGF